MKAQRLERGGGRPVVLLLGVLIPSLLAAMTGCGVQDTVFGKPPPITTAAPPPSPPPAVTVPPVRAGICLDVSSSVPRAMFLEARDTVAGIVQGWPRPVVSDAANPPWPGLDLSVRLIGADVYGPGGELVPEASIPGIPSVIAPGDPTSDGFVDWDGDRRIQLAQAEDAFATADGQARDLAGEIRVADPPMAFKSGVWDCISALAELGVRRIAAITDFKQYGPPQIAGNLKGIPVLGVIACWEAAPCEARKARWTSALRARGATEVTFIRFEQLQGALERFLKEG